LGNTYLFSRLIEGHFPNYDQVIPKDEKITATVGREEALAALRRAALLTSAESQAVKIDFLKNKTLFSSRSPNLGEAREEIESDTKGGDVAIGFNPNYLIDALKNLQSDKISFSLTEPDRPGVLKGEEGYLYVIMPMQLI
jgi:DNA polymerase-3 subunit beta